MIALIDGDMVIYMASTANQMSVDLGDGLGDEPIVDVDAAIRSAITMVKEWQRKAGASSSLVCLSSGTSFRARLWPPYKAGRPDKPQAYWKVREALEFEFDSYQEHALEADDLMGIAGSSDKAQSVIVSRDKDMKTVPALVLNPDHDAKPVRIRPSIADQMWLKQTMTGDSTDNYPGIPKVGPITAQEIILNPHRLTPVVVKGKTKWIKGEPTSIWQSMVDYMTKAGKTEEDLILQAQLSRILRAGEFDKERRVVRLWRPSGYQELSLDGA